MTDFFDLPDETLCYVPGHGETTFGAIRGPERASSEEDATIRMWIAIMLYDPGAKPWKTGKIKIGSKMYPLSVCFSDRFIPLSTSASDFLDEED